MRLASWRAKQRDFLTQTGRAEDSFRSQVYGFGRSQAAAARAAGDRRHAAWLHEIGADGGNAPKTLAKYYEMKYNNSPEYLLLRQYAQDVENGWVSPNVGFQQYESVFRFIEEKIVGVKTPNGIKVTGQSRHFIQRVCGTMADPEKLEKEPRIIRRSGVEIEDVLETLLHGKVKSPKQTGKGESQLFYDRKRCCAVSVNPKTGILIQCQPM